MLRFLITIPAEAKMKEVTAQQAWELMQADDQCLYLDVRSVPEFEAGHAVRAINIPIMHFAPGVGMTPNNEFTAVVEATVPKDAKLMVGCKTGARSARAAEILTQMGYTDVTNIRGGFVGVMDQMGRLVEPGWSVQGLPLCDSCPDDARYDSLAARAKETR